MATVEFLGDYGVHKQGERKEFDDPYRVEQLLRLKKIKVIEVEREIEVTMVPDWTLIISMGKAIALSKLDEFIRAIDSEQALIKWLAEDDRQGAQDLLNARLAELRGEGDSEENPEA